MLAERNPSGILATRIRFPGRSILRLLFRLWRDRRVALRLETMPDYLLDDVGITRSELASFHRSGRPSARR